MAGAQSAQANTTMAMPVSRAKAEPMRHRPMHAPMRTVETVAMRFAAKVVAKAGLTATRVKLAAFKPERVQMR